MFNSPLITLDILLDQLAYTYQHRIGFQMSGAANFERIIDLHNYICYFLIVILFIVLWLLMTLIDRYSILHNINNLHYTQIRHNFLYYYNKKFLEFKTDDILSILKLPSYDLLHLHTMVDENGNQLNTPDVKFLLAGFIDHNNLYFKFIWSYILVSLNLEDIKFTENKFLEFNWTIIPCFILAIIAIPSFYVLYSNEEILNPGLTIKLLGHQWYWTLDYSELFPYWYNLVENSLDIDDFVIDSYMEPAEDMSLNYGSFRLLETEEPLILPIRLHLRLIITAEDVLHSFAMPAMGLKVDAVPGRMNELELFIKRGGLFFGQCSEICGIGHGFMPIELYSVAYIHFLMSDWWLNPPLMRWSKLI